MGILAHFTEPAPQVPMLATEQNFAAIHGRFKIVLLLNNGEGLVHYGQEANASIEDMMTGKVTSILLDAQQGLADCQRKALQMQSNCAAAVLYKKKLGDWVPVSWYVQGEMVSTENIRFKNPVARCRLQLNNNMLSVTKIGNVPA